MTTHRSIFSPWETQQLNLRATLPPPGNIPLTTQFNCWEHLYLVTETCKFLHQIILVRVRPVVAPFSPSAQFFSPVAQWQEGSETCGKQCCCIPLWRPGAGECPAAARSWWRSLPSVGASTFSSQDGWESGLHVCRIWFKKKNHLIPFQLNK